MPGASTNDDLSNDPRARGDIVDDLDDADKTPDTADDAADDKPAAKASDAAADDKPAADKDADDKDEPPRKPVMIPKARFDDARRKDRERIKALEEQLARANQGKDAPPTPEQRIGALETQSTKLMEDYTKALDEGDTKKAAEIMTRVRQIDRDIVRIETAAVSARDRAIAVEQVRLDALIDSLEDKYPQLREGSDEYDADLVEEITELRTAFEARGYASSDALRRAVKYVLAETGESRSTVSRDVDKAATAADKEADKASKAEQLARERTAEAVRRNVRTAKGQPSAVDKAPGVDSHKIGGGVDLSSVPSMSDADFDALPEATRRKLRGDYFAPTV